MSHPRDTVTRSRHARSTTPIPLVDAPSAGRRPFRWSSSSRPGEPPPRRTHAISTGSINGLGRSTPLPLVELVETRRPTPETHSSDLDRLDQRFGSIDAPSAGRARRDPATHPRDALTRSRQARSTVGSINGGIDQRPLSAGRACRDPASRPETRSRDLDTLDQRGLDQRWVDRWAGSIGGRRVNARKPPPKGWLSCVFLS
ncbi:hypothetical protein HNR05_002012 [Leifsonia psychrotolerans]|uniref:Uncharacterized protein n=1 Tax=Glaciibacter psychrotolerans TaxID=670054 RepID=A0A7Z0EEV8_9MICO|nr:hypothetical protein [Leifsonia psychrotolerans]